MSNLYFWRDNTGNEIDILLEHGERLRPIEIKSGQTISRDQFSGLRKWTKLAVGEKAQVDTPYLVYGGTEAQTRSGIEVEPWLDIAALIEKNTA